MKLRKALVEAYACEFKLTTDWVKPGVQEETRFEILVGETVREASKNALDSLGPGAFVIKADGDKIVILGNTPKGTDAAVDYFIQHYISADVEELTPVANLLYNGSYQEPGTIYITAKGMNNLAGFGNRRRAALYLPSGAAQQALCGGRVEFTRLSGFRRIRPVLAVLYDGSRQDV